jgi:hypothetical protein
VLEAVAQDRAAAGRPVTDPFDVLIHGTTPADDPAEASAITRPYAEAGATWWTERINPSRGSLEQMRERVRQGPPRP